MGHKVNPRGFRLPQDNDWESRWFGETPKIYRENLLTDMRIRSFLLGRLKLAGLTKVQIERSINKMRIVLYVSRPGVVIGRGGSGLELLKKELGILIKMADPKKNLEIEAVEVKDPDLSAYLTAQRVAEQLEKRMPYRRVATKTIQRAIASGAKGIKIVLGGRVGGAEISRVEKFTEGKLPLSTLRADIDYASVPAFTKSGYVGVKVWIYRGERH